MTKLQKAIESVARLRRDYEVWASVIQGLSTADNRNAVMIEQARVLQSKAAARLAFARRQLQALANGR